MVRTSALLQHEVLLPLEVAEFCTSKHIKRWRRLVVRTSALLQPQAPPRLLKVTEFWVTNKSTRWRRLVVRTSALHQLQVLLPLK